MGGLLTCICCYCCLTTLKPRIIEIVALICNIIEIGFLIWGIVDVPWSDIKMGGKVMFYIACVLVILTFLFLLGLMCLRCGNKINTTKNGAGKCLCITDLVFDILAEIAIIIAEIIILNNMNDKDDNSFFDYGYRYNSRYSKYSRREWAAAAISITAAEIFIGLHCYCVSFLLKLIYLKTNLSYLKYRDTQEPNDDIIGRTINVFNTQDNNVNQLKFLGYDKDGHPIYSGNAQYFTQSQAPGNPNNMTNVPINANQQLKVYPPK